MKTRKFLISFVAGITGGAVVMIIGLLIMHLFLVRDNNKHPLVQQYDYYSHPVALQKTGLLSLPVTESTDFTVAAGSAVNAVVHVKTQFNAPNYTLYDYLFGTSPSYSTPVMSSGSGVILSEDGYIITNNHVIEKAEIIQVVLNDKRSYDAKIIGKDATSDLALLKINETGLPYIPYANSDDIKIGEWVLAVGNPFNLTSTVTAGIISAKARNIDIMGQNMHIESFIQTDAAINPGNSGGALVNIKGELIGINSAIASQTGSFVGYSFAIPSNIVRKVVADFIEYGDVQRAYLGAEFTDIDAKLAQTLNMDKPMGVYVAGVWDEAIKSKVDLKKGDIILEVNKIKINSSSELLEQLSKYRPGDHVAITLISNGVLKTVDVVLLNKYGTIKMAETENVDMLGAGFEPVPENEKQKLRLKNGMKVKSLSAGKLLSKGVQEGYIITRINNQSINTVEDIENALKNSDGAVFIEGIYPNGMVAYYAFGL